MTLTELFWSKEMSAAKACILCGIILTKENQSKEHIIPRSIGGRVKRGGIICNSCNNRKGHEWDQELFNQLHFLCLHFKITRQGSPTPSKVVKDINGDEFTRLPDGRLAIPEAKVNLNWIDGKPYIEGSAPDERSMRRELKRISQENPALNLDIEKLMRGVSYSSHKPTQPLIMTESLPFGGSMPGRSIVSTCLILGGYNGITREDCPLAIDYLLKDGEPCFGYYYQNDLVINRPEGIVFHCASIVADPVLGMVMGYVEYFSCFRVVACLSCDYHGSYTKDSYAFNVITGRTITLDTKIQFSQDGLSRLYNYDYCDTEKYGEAVRKSFELGITRSR